MEGTVSNNSVSNGDKRGAQSHVFAKQERDKEKAEARGMAMNDLSMAEKSAEDVKLNEREDSLNGARENEIASDGFYRGGEGRYVGRGDRTSQDNRKSDNNDKNKSFLKKNAPVFLIVVLILALVEF